MGTLKGNKAYYLESSDNSFTLKKVNLWTQ